MVKTLVVVHPIRRLLLTAVLLGFSLTVSARQLVTYSLHYADPEQVSQVISTYLSAGSSVSAYQNQLIVNGTPEELARVRTLIDQLDVRGRQVLISVKTGGNSHFRAEDNSASGSVRVDRKNGVDVHTRVTVREYQSRGQSAAGQGVRATEGQPAYISVGSRAPVSTTTRTANGRQTRSQQYVNAGSGFYATAWIDKDSVRIVIDQQREQWRGGVIEGQQLQTEVNGRLGEWLPVGMISGAEVSEQSAQDRYRRSGSGSEAIYLKVELLDS